MRIDDRGATVNDRRAVVERNAGLDTVAPHVDGVTIRKFEHNSVDIQVAACEWILRTVERRFLGRVKQIVVRKEWFLGIRTVRDSEVAQADRKQYAERGIDWTNGEQAANRLVDEPELRVREGSGDTGDRGSLGRITPKRVCPLSQHGQAADATPLKLGRLLKAWADDSDATA